MAELLEFEITDVMQEFFERGWTDGLPVVPPTPELVDAMVATVDLDRTDVVGGFLGVGGV